MIESAKENKQDNQQETIDCLKEEILNNNKKLQETIDCLKEQIKVNNKKQQETTESSKQEMITLKESVNNEKQPITNNLTINNENEEPLDEELIMISNILKEPRMNKSLIMNESIDDDLKELLINDTLKCSMRHKILTQPINNKRFFIKRTNN